MRLALKMKAPAAILWYERMLKYITGESYSLGRLTETGERNINMERLFNMREGLTGKVRTIIGGAPVSADFAEEIGADAYAYDAANAVERVKELIG